MRRLRGLAVVVFVAASAGAAWLVLRTGRTHPAIAAAVLARADQDGDGALSAAEYAEVAGDDEPLARYDIDGDGALSGSEIETFFLGTSPLELRQIHAAKVGDPGAGREGAGTQGPRGRRHPGGPGRPGGGMGGPDGGGPGGFGRPGGGSGGPDGGGPEADGPGDPEAGGPGPKGAP